MEYKGDVVCLVSGISVSFQKSYFYYTNYLFPLSMLLSVWCFVANAAVIIGLFRSGIKTLRPGLLFLCSLTLTDLLWGATVAPIDAGFRMKNTIEKQSPCGIDTKTTELPFILFIATTNLGSILNLAVISIDRYLAVKHFSQYKFMMTRCRAIAACCVVWVIAITIGILAQVDLLYPQLPVPLKPLVYWSGAAILAVSVPLIAILQIMTIRELRRHNNNVAEMMEEGGQANPVRTANAAIERSLTKALTYVVGLLILTFIPTAAALVATIITKKPLTHLMNPILFTLVTLGSGINPILYYRGNEKVKQGILKLVKCQ